MPAFSVWTRIFFLSLAILDVSAETFNCAQEDTAGNRLLDFERFPNDLPDAPTLTCAYSNAQTCSYFADGSLDVGPPSTDQRCPDAVVTDGSPSTVSSTDEQPSTKPSTKPSTTSPPSGGIATQSTSKSETSGRSSLNPSSSASRSSAAGSIASLTSSSSAAASATISSALTGSISTVVSPPRPSALINAPSNPNNSRTRTGAIVGSILGLAFVAAMLLLVWCITRRRRIERLRGIQQQYVDEETLARTRTEEDKVLRVSPFLVVKGAEAPAGYASQPVSMTSGTSTDTQNRNLPDAPTGDSAAGDEAVARRVRRMEGQLGALGMPPDTDVGSGTQEDTAPGDEGLTVRLGRMEAQLETLLTIVLPEGALPPSYSE